MSRANRIFIFFGYSKDRNTTSLVDPFEFNFSRPLIQSQYDFLTDTPRLSTSLDFPLNTAEEIRSHLKSLFIILVELALGIQIKDARPMIEPRLWGSLVENIESIYDKIRDEALGTLFRAIVACAKIHDEYLLSSSTSDIFLLIRSGILCEFFKDPDCRFSSKNPTVDF